MNDPVARTIKTGIVVLSIWLALMVSAAGQEAPAEGDDVDRLALASLLIGDGNFERARTVLAGVDPDDENLDRMRFYSLEGLVALNLEELARAAAAFERVAETAAERAEPVPEVIWLYLAQAYFGQQEYAGVLRSLDRAATGLGVFDARPIALGAGRSRSGLAGAVGRRRAFPRPGR